MKRVTRISSPDPRLDRAYGAMIVSLAHSATQWKRCRPSGMETGSCYCLASGAFSTCLQAAGICASVIGGFGFGGSGGGFGCSTPSENQ